MASSRQRCDATATYVSDLGRHFDQPFGDLPVFGVDVGSVVQDRQRRGDVELCEQTMTGERVTAPPERVEVLSASASMIGLDRIDSATSKPG